MADHGNARNKPANAQAPPFSAKVLHRSQSSKVDAKQSDMRDLLPASYRTVHNGLDCLCVPEADLSVFLEQVLDLRRLNSIFAWLWVAGRPMPPRPLHHQLLLDREVFVTEVLDTHLVWTSGRVYIKPMCRFLLDPRFWLQHLSCREQCSCTMNSAANDSNASQESCKQRKLRQSALGFLFTYSALISNESDFRIAVDKYLVPSEVEWPAWRALVQELLQVENIYQQIDQRFVYGELRLERLNYIYLFRRPFFRIYMQQWRQYSDFFRDNFTSLALMVVYMSVVLAAMQVGLATALVDNDTFRSASYGFVVFSIIGPIIAAAIVVCIFLCVFVNNYMTAITYKRGRLCDVQEKSFP